MLVIVTVQELVVIHDMCSGDDVRTCRLDCPDDLSTEITR
jgi:hypothetical protein